MMGAGVTIRLPFFYVQNFLYGPFSLLLVGAPWSRVRRSGVKDGGCSEHFLPSAGGRPREERPLQGSAATLEEGGFLVHDGQGLETPSRLCRCTLRHVHQSVECGGRLSSRLKP